MTESGMTESGRSGRPFVAPMRPARTAPAALPPIGGLDVWQLLSRRSETAPDRPFMIWQPYDAPPVVWTYARLRRAAAGVAAGLARRGVRPGQRVLVHLENCPEFVVAWFACAALGAVAVTTNARSAADELAYYVGDSGVVGAITQPKFVARVAAAAPGVGWLVATDNDTGTPAAIPGEAEPFSALPGDPDELRRRPPHHPMSPMSIQYTSGTTARPKGVVWTHANVLWAARVNAAHEDLHPTDRHLVYHPLFHTNAIAFSVLPSLWVGAAFVLVPKWSTSRFWDVSLRHGCTWLSLMGLSYRALLAGDVPAGHRYRLMGTGTCDTPLDERLGAKTIGWWAMTETVSHGIVGSPYAPDRPLSMGRPAAEYDIAVVRDDGMTPVEPDETGHLLVRGRRGVSLFAEYLNQPAATEAAFDEWGWFHTGDLATYHDDGYLTFADRAKDMLRVGGENVAALEVERVIMESGLVREAAVVGRPDGKLDEVPVAFVVARGDTVRLGEQVLAFCERRLADFKVPRAVIVVRELPRSTISKVNKVELRGLTGTAADVAAAERRWIGEAHLDPSGEY